MAQDFPCSGRSGEAAGQAWFLSFTNLERCHKEPAKKEGEAEPWQSQKKVVCRDQSSSSKGRMGTRENILASYGLNVEKSPEKETLVVSSSEEGSCAETPVSGSGGSLVAFFDQQLLCMKRVLPGGTVELACVREGSAGLFGIPMAQFHYLGIV